MTADLVPLRTAFDVGWLGYRRDQVQHYVGETERDFELLATDRDAAEARALSLTKALEAAREENRLLRDRVDRLCRQPLSPDSVGERLRHAVDSALSEAAAIVERAGAIEDHVWASARQTHAEHRDLLTTTRERMSRLVREGEARRRALDEAAAQQRAQADEDFELALALRRKETLRDARLIEETARRRADQTVREAARQVEVLREHRDHVAEVLRVVHALLGKAAGHVRAGENAPGGLSGGRCAERSGAGESTGGDGRGVEGPRAAESPLGGLSGERSGSGESPPGGMAVAGSGARGASPVGGGREVVGPRWDVGEGAADGPSTGPSTGRGPDVVGPRSGESAPAGSSPVPTWRADHGLPAEHGRGGPA
ncbi:hypothetical protein ACWGE0_03385 [Lentzea sp. NPDC054927]